MCSGSRLSPIATFGHLSSPLGQPVSSMLGPTTFTSSRSPSQHTPHIVTIPPDLMSSLYRNNVNAAMVFEFCYRFITIAKSYFGKLDEESVKNNFVLIYELIDGASLVSLPPAFDIEGAFI